MSATPHFASDDLGPRTFYDGDGNVFLSSAIKVIDVSEWQGTIDWAKVARTDVDAAILRLGFGSGGLDKCFGSNVSGCQQNGIPFGAYLISYAYDENYAALEGQFAAATLKRCGLPADFPVFYDLEVVGRKDQQSGRYYWDEKATDTRHYMPTTVAAYRKIVDAFFGALEAAGYTAGYIYSGPSFTSSYLNDPAILRRVAWAAQYWRRLQYRFSTPENQRAWQYTNTGVVDGISGGVDVSAFSLFPYFASRLYAFTDVSPTTAHASDISWLSRAGISKGWRRADGSYEFRPNARVARADMAAFLYRLAGSPAFDASQACDFADTGASTSHYKEILWLGSTGISAGWRRADGSREFRPNASIARADMAAFLYRLAGSPAFDASQAGGFVDVSASTSHYKEILWLGSTGISAGWRRADGSREFRPNASIARGDMAAFLHRQSARGLVQA